MRVRNSARNVGRAVMLLAATATLAMMTAGGGVAPLANAATAAACHAANCAGHDPTVYGCSATSTTTSSGALATVWNRYSAGCDANWGRAQLTTAALNAGDQMEITIDTVDSDHNGETMCWPSPGNNEGFDTEFCNGYYAGSSIAYTDMVDGTNLTQTYVIVVNSSGNFLAEYKADQ
jgi:hypothetical protein